VQKKEATPTHNPKSLTHFFSKATFSKIVLWIILFSKFSFVHAQFPDLLVVNNHKQLLPFQDVSVPYACVTIGQKGTKFRQTISEYAPTHTEFVETDSAIQTTFLHIAQYPKVIIGVFEDTAYASPNHFGISGKAIEWIRKLDKKTDLALVIFGRPQALPYFLENSTIIYSKLTSENQQSQVAQGIFGATSIPNQPIFHHFQSPIPQSVTLKPLGRLQFDVEPKMVGMSKNVLKKIDNIVQQAITSKATSGCQVLVARNGKVIFNKAYGHYTYENQQVVTENSLYDVASLTKVLATTSIVMKLLEEGKVDLDTKISEYLSDLQNTNKKNLTIRQILLHRAGLSYRMPGYPETFKDTLKFAQFYKSQPSKTHSLRVSENMYTYTNQEDSLWKWIKKTPLYPQRRDGNYAYKYGDIGFFILKRICEKVTQTPLEKYFEKHFLIPLALQKMTYLPLEKHPKSQIVPAGNEPYFRKTIPQGYVHDYAAGMVGGVGGHAGIFSNAKDIAILMQVFLQNGYYGGRKYFQQKTIKQFTSIQNNLSSRGLGWDKPRSYGKYNPASNSASRQAFGHRGFTGTCVWSDPKYNLTYVFLSNRTLPSSKNRKLQHLKIRRRIHDVIYSAIQK